MFSFRIYAARCMTKVILQDFCLPLRFLSYIFRLHSKYKYISIIILSGREYKCSIYFRNEVANVRAMKGPVKGHTAMKWYGRIDGKQKMETWRSNSESIKTNKPRGDEEQKESSDNSIEGQEICLGF